MFSKTILPLFFFLSTLPFAFSKPTPCAKVHIIAARGSTEPQGPGAIGILVDRVKTLKPTCTISNDSVVYPATLENYPASSGAGTAALKALLTDQVKKCPGQDIVLVGYSQGAHIIGDAVAGGAGGDLGPITPPVAPNVYTKIRAIVLLGDPRHTAGKPFNKGTAQGSGMFPRPAQIEYPAVLKNTGRIQDYCDATDYFCDTPGTSVPIHLTYLERYLEPAANFIVSKL